MVILKEYSSNQKFVLLMRPLRSKLNLRYQHFYLEIEKLCFFLLSRQFPLLIYRLSSNTVRVKQLIFFKFWDLFNFILNFFRILFFFLNFFTLSKFWFGNGTASGFSFFYFLGRCLFWCNFSSFFSFFNYFLCFWSIWNVCFFGNLD